MRSIVTFLVLVCLCSYSFAQKKLPYGIKGGEIVDQYKLKKHIVDVYFFDPMDSIVVDFPRFADPDSLTLDSLVQMGVEPDTATQKEKAEMWRKYIKYAPVYVFVLRKKKEGVISYYCFRGNPASSNPKFPQKLEAIKPNGIDTLDVYHPESYAKNIKRTYKSLRVGGSLFEDMKMFRTPETRQYVNKPAPFCGYRVWVAPYTEFKNVANFYIFGEYRIK